MSLADNLTKNVAQAQRDADDGKTANAIKLLEGVIHQQLTKDDLSDEVIKAKENATYMLARLYKDKQLIDELIELQKVILPLFIMFPKSKQARITRSLFDLTMSVDAAHERSVPYRGPRALVRAAAAGVAGQRWWT